MLHLPIVEVKEYRFGMSNADHLISSLVLAMKHAT
jgi:hypothetical protein